MNIVLTGFEPFGGESINPALQAVEAVASSAGFSVGSVSVHAVQVPVEFGRSVEVVMDAVRRWKADVVLMVGQAGGRADIAIERVALNLDDASIPDNAGNKPVDQPIDPEGPAAYFATVDAKAIVAAIRDAGIPASLSHSAGTYVCNHLFYGVLHNCHDCHNGHKHHDSATTVRVGFIHVPFLPSQTVGKPAIPSMSLDTLVTALQVAVQVCTQQR